LQPLGAVDYLELASEFDTLILRNIPAMDLERKAEARRFTYLIDTMYDARVSFTKNIKLLVHMGCVY